MFLYECIWLFCNIWTSFWTRLGWVYYITGLHNVDKFSGVLNYLKFDLQKVPRPFVFVPYFSFSLTFCSRIQSTTCTAPKLEKVHTPSDAVFRLIFGKRHEWPSIVIRLNLQDANFKRWHLFFLDLPWLKNFNACCHHSPLLLYSSLLSLLFFMFLPLLPSIVPFFTLFALSSSSPSSHAVVLRQNRGILQGSSWMATKLSLICSLLYHDFIQTLDFRVPYPHCLPWSSGLVLSYNESLRLVHSLWRSKYP